MTDDLGELVAALQSHGLRVQTPVETRTGGAGPTDSGMIWLEGRPVTVPTDPDSEYVLRPEDGGGNGVYRDGRRLAGVSRSRRPRFYDRTTADGTPYWKIALLHLDSLASTVVQACNYWNTSDQCGFCGIGLSLDSGATIAKKTPEQLAEVAVAARDLDGAVDVTLTTGSSTAPDRGARYVARCGRAVKDASGLPVEIQFEPPRDLAILDEVHATGGADAVGIHIESFDPDVLARVAPGKARTGIETYFRTWERAVALWGRGRVSTYVILGMGEDPDVTVEGCRRAVDMGVYPFVVPLRPVAGSLMEHVPAPSAEYSADVYERVAAHMTLRGMSSDDAVAGCARCQACSAIDAVQRGGGTVEGKTLVQIGPRPASLS
jgi:radical SAM protein (TIGR04043 family)